MFDAISTKNWSYLRLKATSPRTILSWTRHVREKSIETRIRVSPRHFLPQEIPGSFKSTRRRFAWYWQMQRRVPRRPLVRITDRRRSVSPLYQVSNFTCSLHVTSDYFSQLTPQHPSSISRVNLLFNLPMAFVKRSLIIRPNVCFVNERRYPATLLSSGVMRLYIRYFS